MNRLSSLIKCQINVLIEHFKTPSNIICQVETLCKQHALLKDRATNRQKDISDSHTALEKLTEALNAMQHGIAKASASLDAIGPVAGDVAALKALQDELKVDN